MPDPLDCLDEREREWLRAIRRRSARRDRMVGTAAALVVLIVAAQLLAPAEGPRLGPLATATAAPRPEQQVVADGRRALAAWGHFAVTNDLAAVRPFFWANGPQFRQLARQASLRARQRPLGLPAYRFALTVAHVATPMPDYRVLGGQVRVSRPGEAVQIHRWNVWMRHDARSDRWRLWTVARTIPGPGLARSRSDPVVVAAGDISPPRIGGQKQTSDRVLAIGPKAVLTLGDNQYPNGSLAHFRRYYHPTWGRFKAITKPTPGNHEYDTPGAEGYFRYFGAAARPAGKSYYSFDLGGWHLIALDSEIDGQPGSPQDRWLREDLAGTRKRCILAYWHLPRFSSGAHEGDKPSVAPFWNALYLARADLVLSGHEHSYERFAPQGPGGRATPQGIRQFVVGTGGAYITPFTTPRPNSQVRRSNTWGLLALTLHQGGYSWRFESEDGDVLDRGGPVACH
jgi:Calcineurin-like phosphoesterase